MGRSVLLVGVVASWALLTGPATLQAELIKIVEGRRITIDRNTPVKDLLPIPPKAPAKRRAFPTDLTRVPEVLFQDPHSLGLSKNPGERLKQSGRDIARKTLDRLRKKHGDKLSNVELMAKLDEEAVEREKAEERIGYQLARVNFLNRNKTDHFLEVLCENRPDLAGLPFVMGDRCRLGKSEHRQFGAAVLLVQASLGPDQEDPRNFWQYYDRSRKRQKQNAVADQEGEPEQKPATFTPPADRFCVAALTQMLAVESAELQLSLVQRLPEFEATDADRKAVTVALSRLAVFSQEAAIRQAALEHLKKRGKQQVADILLQGLRYPWPGIARNAAEAIVELKRTDLLPQLMDMLDEPDPRSPVLQDVKGAKVPVVRELVRISHLRNCMLCHPPARLPNVAEESKKKLIDSMRMQRTENRRSDVDILQVGDLFAAVPPPGHELTDPSEGGYGRSLLEFQIRADVTYLRQDFSLVQHVDNADPWPEQQRFDFLVRSRVLTEAEANDVRAELAREQVPSPYRETALSALRRLTGRDAGNTGDAWRRSLGVK